MQVTSAVLSILLMALLGAVARAADAEGGPIWPSAPAGRVAVVPTAPDLDRADPLADPAWNDAEPLGPFFSSGKMEDARTATEVRLVVSDGVLYIAARCLEPEGPGAKPADPDVPADAFQFCFTQGGRPLFPFVAMEFSPSGSCRATLYFRAFGRWKETRPASDLDASRVVVKTGKAASGGWWLAAAVPAREFGIPEAEFSANFLRLRAADGSRYAWADTRNRPIFAPYHFGGLTAAKPPLAPRPRIVLPALLAVGVNSLRLSDWQDGWTLKANGSAVPTTADGNAAVAVADYGPATLELAGPSGAVVETYSAAVPRPLVMEAIEPFEEDLAKPLRVTLGLEIAGAEPVDVTLVARQAPLDLARKTIALSAGRHEIEIQLKGAAPGEIDISAEAALALPGGKNASLAARHWCSRGVAREDVDRFREGLDSLETRSLYRAALADASNFYHVIQAGDGRYRTLRHDRGFGSSEWNFGMVYAFALLYKSDWPENPYRGDPRFLASAIAGLEAGVDPATSYPQGAEARNLGAYLMAYDLIKDDVPAETRAYWEKRLTEIVEEVIETRVGPATYLYEFYSTDVGTGTNHYAYYSQDVYAAGRVLDRPDWVELGKNAVRRLARHARYGNFPERRGVPVTHYTWLSMNALGEYCWVSGDRAVLPVLEKCVEFSCHTSLAATETMLCHDGRNNDYHPYYSGDFVLSLTPNGRALARARFDSILGSRSRPSSVPPEYWYRTAENALYFEPGPAQPLPEDTEFAFLDGRGLIVRSKGFIYGLSAICVPATWDTYLVDAQNTIELHHVKAGHILHGANSQSQPEAGSFMRRVGDRTVFLPADGSIEMTDVGRMATLVFDAFSVRLLCEVISGRQARVTVELLSADGPEPVIYNFFPAVTKAGEPAVSDDGRTLEYGKVELRCSRPPEIERNFKIINPYSQKFTVDTAPVRAHVPLERHNPFVMDIAVAP